MKIPTISELALDHNRLMLAIVFGLMLFGAFSYYQLPKQEDPKIKIREAVVTTAYPGMSDEEIKKAKQKKTTPFNGSLNAHSHLKDINQPAAMKPQGEQVEVPEFTQPTVEAVMLDNLSLRKRVSEALHRPLDAPEAAFLRELGEVDESELTAIIEQVAQGIKASVSPLRAVN